MVYIKNWDRECLALSVESVDFVQIRVVKALVRKILIVRLKFDLLVSGNLFFFYVVEKVMVGERMVVEKVDENDIVIDESAHCIRIREVLNSHSKVV